jgi:hypothetical protein
MSADAKMWQDEDGSWCAVHDGDCTREHRESHYGLVDVIQSVNACMAPYSIKQWHLHVYPDGKAGLRGFTW